MITDTFWWRVQGVVATLLAVERLHGQDTGADGGGPGVARWAGRPVAWPVVFCRPGAAEAPGSRPAAGRRRRRCAAALRPEGRPRMLRGARWVVSGGAGRLRCGPCAFPAPVGLRRWPGPRPAPARGFPAQGLARPGVELRGDRIQVLAAVHRQVRAFGEVLAQQPVGVLAGAALPGRVRVAEVDLQVGGQADL